MNYHNNNDLILKLVLSKINYTFYEKKSLKKKENIICQKWMNEIRGKNYLILKLIKKLTKMIIIIIIIKTWFWILKTQ